MAISQEILAHIIKPVIRFCLRHHINFKDLTESVKNMFVAEAAKALIKDGKAVSASRIHLMTGVHRIDIARLQLGDIKTEQSQLLVKVIGHWQNKFCTKSGEPRVLSATGVESDFFQMVQEVGKDLNPYTVLFELERLSMIKKTRTGIKLIRPELILSENLEVGTRMYSQDSDDLLCAIEENTSHSPSYAARHHLRTEYDSVASEGIPAIRKWIHKEGEQIHAKARKCIGKFDSDNKNNKSQDSENGKFRVVFTSFAFIEPISKKGENQK